MKRWILLLFFSILLAGLPLSGQAFPLAAKTRAELYPHILKSDAFELNVRNIKALAIQGRYLWMGTSKGVIRYDTTTENEYTVFDNQNALLSNGIFEIAFGPRGRPWIGTYAGGLSLFDGGDWIHINTPHGLNDAFVYDVEFAGDETWIATWSGVNRVRGDLLSRDSWEAFTVKNTQGGLIDNWVYAIEIGSDGRIWFGTESGVSMRDGDQWSHWDRSRGLSAPRDLVEADNRGIMDAFQGTHHAGHGQELPNIGSQGYRPNYVVSMILDRQNKLWIGTWGGGLTVLDTRTLKLRNFSVRDGLPGNYILALEEGPLGNLWIGTNAGLSQFDGERFLNYSRINGLSSQFVFSLRFGPDGSLWVGGHNTLDRFKIDPQKATLHGQ